MRKKSSQVKKKKGDDFIGGAGALENQELKNQELKKLK